MTESFRQFLPLLNALSQPAVWLEDRRVAWRGAAAERLGVEKGGFFPELPENCGAPCRFPVTLADETWDAVLQPFEGGMLLFFEKDGSDDVGALRALSRGLKPIVSSAVAAGSELFPRIEELEDESMQTSAAQLSRDCYRLLRTVGSLEQYSRMEKNGLIETCYLFKSFYAAILVNVKIVAYDLKCIYTSVHGYMNFFYNILFVRMDPQGCEYSVLISFFSCKNTFKSFFKGNSVSVAQLKRRQ